MTSNPLSSRSSVAREWADEEGRPLGVWVEVERDEWQELIRTAGGLEALTVFSTLTDPDGCYGPAQVYTAWGARESDVPFVDACDYKGADGRTERQVLRRFRRDA